MKQSLLWSRSGLFDLSLLQLSAFTTGVVISTDVPLVLIILPWFPFSELPLSRSEAKWSLALGDGVGLSCLRACFGAKWPSPNRHS